MASTGGEGTTILRDWRADIDFAETFELEMVKGRYFSAEFPTDSSAAVINEAAVVELDLTDPLGKSLEEMGPTPDRSAFYNIIGVVKDFHFESLHQKIRPMVIKLPFRNSFYRETPVRIRSENIQETIAFLEKTWKKFATDQAFEYIFFDDDIAALYRPEQRTGQILTMFSIFTFIIACLGLFGLASFTAEQRTKEIGIRKTLGSSVSNIVVLLSKEFSKWVLIANVLAWPVAYFMMNRWLQNFEYQTNLNFLIFLVATVISLFIAWLTVSYQSIKAALANPVDALKYE
jgi:putative ABC transport system permease protein